MSREELFRVSDKKTDKVKAALKLFLESETTTPRQLAAVAGKLISLSPAFLPASLYSQTLFEAIQGKLSWDEIFPTSEAVRDTLEQWMVNLLAWNGRHWYAQPISQTVSSDALDFGFGGLVVLPDEKKIPVSGSLTKARFEFVEHGSRGRGLSPTLGVDFQAVPGDDSSFDHPDHWKQSSSSSGG